MLTEVYSRIGMYISVIIKMIRVFRQQLKKMS